MKRSILFFALCLAVSPLASRAAASDPGFTASSCKLGTHTVPGSLRTVTVDQHGNGNYSTIKEAVNNAQEGDHIVVHDGTYHEAVVVTTDGVRISGEHRDRVILDGHAVDANGDPIIGPDNKPTFLSIGIQVYADRVVLENMTAHHYVQHGFVWGDRTHGGTGYWGRYLNAYNNGDYGIFAFDYRCGQFDHSFTWGNADSGFYIGNCYPCDAVITDIEADHNALGYSGTNAGGHLILKDSWWHDNAMGIVPSSLDSENRPPQRDLTIENNIIDNNNTFDAPGVGLAGIFWGVGIALPGVQSDNVFGNAVTNHDLAGIVIAPLPDTNVYIASGNTVWGNTVTHDTTLHPNSFDLGQGATSGPNNCWSNNKTTDGTDLDLTTAPPLLQTLWPCTGAEISPPGGGDPIYKVGQTVTPPGGDPRVEAGLAEGEAGANGRVQSDWRTYLEPPTLDKGDLPAGASVVPWLPEVN